MEQQAMAVREMNWAQSIRAAEESGMTQEAWCAAHGIARSTFYRWKHALKEKILSSTPAQASTPVCFAALKLPQPAEQSTTAPQSLLLHIEDLTIELPLACSEEQLCKVLRAVRHAR